MYEEILKKANECLEANEDLELVELIESSIIGTPRKAGAFMFVNIKGESFGTVGGGNMEYQVTLYAKELLQKKTGGIKEYNLSQSGAEQIGMVCGGNSKMKFTYLKNDSESKEVLKSLEAQNKSKSIVYIFGGGHVSMELAKLVRYVGFEFVVWDDREEFATKDRFVGAKDVICAPMENILDRVNVTKNDMVVVMTRGHVSDYLVEKQMLKSDAGYIGVIGSTNKNKVLKEKLLEGGFSEDELNRVCAPIGFQIAAETPEEIAISIVAELIMYRSKSENRSKMEDKNRIIGFFESRLMS